MESDFKKFNEALQDYIKEHPEQFTSIFMSTTLSVVADLYYRQFLGDIGRDVKDPASIKESHRFALGATKVALYPYEILFGDRWPAVWEALSARLSSPTDIILELMEKRKSKD